MTMMTTGNGRMAVMTADCRVSSPPASSAPVSSVRTTPQTIRCAVGGSGSPPARMVLGPPGAGIGRGDQSGLDDQNPRADHIAQFSELHVVERRTGPMSQSRLTDSVVPPSRTAPEVMGTPFITTRRTRTPYDGGDAAGYKYRLSPLGWLSSEEGKVSCVLARVVLLRPNLEWPRARTLMRQPTGFRVLNPVPVFSIRLVSNPLRNEL